MRQSLLSYLKKSLDSLLLLSLVIAVFLWLYVNYTQYEGMKSKPSVISTRPAVVSKLPEFLESTMEASFKVDPKLIMGQGQNYVPISQVGSVVVTVKGKPDIVKDITIKDIEASLDLAGKIPGKRYIVPVQVKPIKDVLISSIEPPFLNMELDLYQEDDFPVRLLKIGTPTEGYVTSAPTFYPSKVKVKGPLSVLRKVRSAVVYINVEEMKTDVNNNVSVHALDSDGKEVTGILVTPSIINVWIPIRIGVILTKLPVKVITKGTLPDGYQVKKITVNPQEVFVEVKFDKDSNLKAINTEPVDLSNLKKSVTLEVPLVAPKGVILTGVQKAVVLITLTKSITEKSTTKKTMEIE